MNQKLPSLDGWRAVSISCVLLGHSAVAPGFPTMLTPIFDDWLRIGNLGVRFFFCISGFLITWLLLQEKEQSGGISLKRFYIRRALRIIPVAYLYLLILGLLTHYSQSDSAWVANATFTTNFLKVPHPTEHLWSLGIEEQFYLIWPCLLLLAIMRTNGSSMLLKILLVPITLAPVVRLLESKKWFPTATHFLDQGGFLTNSDSLAFGCVAAVLFFYHRPRVVSFYLDHARVATWGGMALILLVAPLHLLHFPGRLQASLFSSMQALGFVLLMLQSILYAETGCFQVLNWRWVRHLGVMSYSIYVWQQMFFNTGLSVFGLKGAWWVEFPWWLLPALLAAHLSYYLVERPLFRLRAKFRA